MVQTVSYGAQIFPYLKNAQIFTCPSDSGVNTVSNFGTTNIPSNFVYGQRWSSYHYRFWMYANKSFPECGTVSLGAGSALTEATLPYPSQTYVFHELWIWHDNRTVSSLPWDTGGGWDPSAKMNFTFADGHAKAFPVDKAVVHSAWAGQGFDYHWPRSSDLKDID